MSSGRFAGSTTARWIGALGLILFVVLLLIPDEATGLLIADLVIGLLIMLALATHLAFHRRWGREELTSEAGLDG